MKGIIDGITWLISTIKMLIDFVFNAISSLISLFTYLGTIVNIVTTTLLTLPDWLIAFGSISLSICVLYIVLGRQGGKN